MFRIDPPQRPENSTTEGNMAKNRMSKDVCDRCGESRPLIPSGSAIGLVQPSYRYWMTWRPDLGRLVSFCGRCCDQEDIFQWQPTEMML